MKRKEDLRVRKTKLNLYNGLVKLMEEKPFEDIKVTDICNKALVNRSTFYDHFNDKYELFESYVKYIGELCDEKINIKISAENFNELYIEYIKLLLDEIETNFELYKVVFKNNYNSVIKKSLVEIFTNNIVNLLEKEYKFKDNYTLKLGVYFYVSGAIDLIEFGFYNNLPFEKDIIIDLFYKIIPKFDKEININ